MISSLNFEEKGLLAILEKIALGETNSVEGAVFFVLQRQGVVDGALRLTPTGCEFLENLRERSVIQ
jgi:hypothetical protein